MNKCPKCTAELTACVPCYLSPIKINSDGAIDDWEESNTDIITEPWESNDDQFYIFCDNGHYFRWNDGWEFDQDKSVSDDDLIAKTSHSPGKRK